MKKFQVIVDLLILCVGVLTIFSTGFYCGYMLGHKNTFTVVTGVRADQSLILKEVSE